MLTHAPVKALTAVALFSILASLPPAHAQNSAAPEASARWQIPATDDGLPGIGPIRRYDWFRKLWVERCTAWAGRVTKDQGAVVFLGDSITQGWGDDFSGYFPGLKIANRGISGDTSRGVLIRLAEDVVALHPRAVVLLIGTNDLEEKAEPEMIATNLVLILAALKKAEGRRPIVLCQVFPSAASMKRPVGQIKKLNQLLGAAVKGDSQIILVETWPLFADAAGDAKPEEFPDLLHPNKVGYGRRAAALRPIFATLDLLETADYQFTPEPGFVSLFNGRDLTGWGYRPTAEADMASARRWQASDPNAASWPFVTNAVSFDGQTASADGRFVAEHGRLVVTTPPEGRKIQQLHTTREFPRDFVLRLEFRAGPNGDSGIYVRGPQLQCRDYPLAGPYRQLKNFRPFEWNEMEITVQNGVAHCLCNGEVLDAAMKVPATGPIGVEGDRGQMEYRRIRIKETTN